MEEGRDFAKTEKFASAASLPTVTSESRARGTQIYLGTNMGQGLPLMPHARQHLGGAQLQRIFSGQQRGFPLAVAQHWRARWQ